MSSPILNTNPYPCSTYGTAQIVLQAPTIAPANGYKVKWRVIGATEWNLYPDQTGTTINVVGVPTCYNIEVSIQANCDGGLGTEIIVPITGASTNCFLYVLNDSATYVYTPCGSQIPTTVTITNSTTTQDRTVCAVQGTVSSSGQFTQAGACAV